jgi:peptidoglycan/LPS O-acetylase OafA/YrhL
VTLRRRLFHVSDSQTSYDTYRATKYFAALDGLRAISVLLVVAYHVGEPIWHLLSGALGVSIFFVISGFIITTMALREEERDGAVSLSAFYVRRACRILPLYFVVLGIYVVLGGVLDYHHGRVGIEHSLPYYMTFLNDFSPYIFRPNTPFTISWTLGVEEKFYLLWPLLAFVILRRRMLARFVVAGLLVVLPVVIQESPAELPSYLPYSQIMVGCLLALSLHYRWTFTWVMAIVRRPWVVLGVFLVIHGLMDSHGTTSLRFLYAPAVAVLMASFLLGNPVWARPLNSRLLVYIGKRSYAIYLVQMIPLAGSEALARHVFPSIHFNGTYNPIGRGAWLLSVAFFLICAVLSIALAELLHRTVERPMIARGRVWTERITGKRPITPPRLATAQDTSPSLSADTGPNLPAQPAA